MQPCALARFEKRPCLLSEQRIFDRFRHPEFHHGLGGDLDGFAGLRIAADARLALLLHELPDAGEGELSVFLHFAESDLGNDVEEKRGGLTIGFGLLGDELKEGGFGILLCSF